MRSRSIQAILASFVVAVMAAVLIAPAGAGATRKPQKPKPTVVTWNRWVVTTTNLESQQTTTHQATPSSTFKYCGDTDSVTSLDVHGHVAHTINNAHFKVQWLLNGTLRDNFNYHWTASGASGPYAKGITNSSGIPPGHWRIQILQGGRTTGISKITLAVDPTLC